jgi:hypothetical protein
MRFAKRTRLCVTLAVVVGTAALFFACERDGKRASSEAEAAPVRARQQAARRPPPIPKAGPLAQPKSIHQVGVPPGATQAAIPSDNPQTPQKIALGEKLFFDGRLSADGTVACSTCHDPARAFTDGRPTSMGIKGRIGQRNAPTILNALYNKTQFWDGRAKTLEKQAALPIANPFEMGQPSLNAAVAKIAAVGEYQRAFRGVFGRPPNGTDLVREGRRLEESLARPGHPAARPDGGRYRRPRCVPRVADEREVQGTGGQGAGAPAQARSDEAAPARYGEGLRPETAPAQAALLTRAHRRKAQVTVDRRAALAEAAAPARIDVMLERPRGGVSLTDPAAMPAQVLVRPPDGARLSADPWRVDADALMGEVRS